MKRNGNFHSALGNAFAGLAYLIKTQKNFRFHLAATVCVILLGLWLQLTIAQWVFIAIAIGLVWISEAFNTSLECFFDLVEPHESMIVKAGKDTAAAAVLFASVLSIVIGLLTMGSAFLQKVSQIIASLTLS